MSASPPPTPLSAVPSLCLSIHGDARAHIFSYMLLDILLRLANTSAAYASTKAVLDWVCGGSIPVLNYATDTERGP